jgi:hypothetical protein
MLSPGRVTVCTVKPLFKVPLGTVEFEHYTQENLIWRYFNADFIDLGALK